MLSFFSCAGTPREQPSAIVPESPAPAPENAPLQQQEQPVPETAAPEITQKPLPSAVPETPVQPERPKVPEYIMGKGIATEDLLAAFLMENNNRVDYDFARSLSGYYIEEAAAEGVNHDIAFAQMCLETGFLRFGNLVIPEQNNFCGLGATGIPGADGIPDKGLYFPNPRTGVRAHIQHLKAYGSTDPLNQELVNPRFRFITRGRSPTIHGLAGTWAADTSYNIKITRILRRLYTEVSVETGI